MVTKTVDITPQKQVFISENTYPINKNIKINSVIFTNRELDIISCLISGRSTKKIASFLELSPKTIEVHIRNVMLKLKCNSRENIIDFLEKTEQFSFLKRHYNNILSKITFELELKKVSAWAKTKNLICLSVYPTTGTNNQKNPFITNLEKHIMMSGVKLLSYPWKAEKLYSSDDIIEKQLITNIVFHLSHIFIEQLEKIKLEDVLTCVTKKHSQIGTLFLLEKPHESLMEFKKINFYNFIDITEQKNYYFLVFAVLKNILSDSRIDKNIEEFNKQYNMLFEKNFFQKLAIDDNLEDLPANNQLKIFNKKSLLLKVGIIFLLIIYLVFYFFSIKTEIKLLKNKLLRFTFFHSDHINSTNNKFNLINEHIIFNLPPRNNKFTGRENHLNQIENQLYNKTNEPIIQIISGASGVGKTQLAAEIAYKFIDSKYYKAILWFTAETFNSINNLYKMLADYLKIDVDGLNINETKKIIHNFLSRIINDSRLLIILDNVQDFNQVQKYINCLHEQLPTTNKHIIITSRSQHWPETPLILDSFTVKESLIFIKKHLPNANKESVDSLSKTLNYFPLALSQAVFYIKTHTNIDDYLKIYTVKPQDYLNKDSTIYDQYKESIWKTYNIVLSKLSDNGKKFLSVAAYLDPEDIPIEYFSNFNIKERAEAIEDLRNHSLVTLSSNGKSFKIHRLLQEIIKLKQQADFKINLESDGLILAIDLLKDKFDFNYLELKKWDLWKKYLIQAKSIAEQAINTKGKTFDEGVKLYAKVVMFMTHILVDDPEETTRMWLNLLKINEKYINNISLSSSLLTAIIYSNLGFIRRIANKPNEAKVYLDQAVEIYQKKSNILAEKELELINLLRVIPIKNKVNIEHQAQYDYCYALTHLGHIFNYSSLINPSIAISNYNKAISEFSKLENLVYIKESVAFQKLYTSYHLAQSYIYLNELVMAEKLLIAVVEQIEKIYINHRQKASIYIKLAKIYTNIGKFKEADQLLKNALDILSVSLKDKHFMINSLKTHIGCNAYRMGHLSFAKAILEEESIYWENYSSNYNDYYYNWYVKLHLTKIYESMNQYNKSLEYMKKNLAIAKQHFKEKIHDYTKFQIPKAENWVKINKRSPLSYWKNMLDLNMELFGKDHYEVAKYHFFLGQALFNFKQTEQAIEQYKKALLILNKEEIKHPNLLKFHQQNLQMLQELIKKAQNNN